MSPTLKAIAEAVGVNGGSIFLQSTLFLLVGFFAAARFKKFGPILQTHFYKVLTAGVVLLCLLGFRGGASTSAKLVVPVAIFEIGPITPSAQSRVGLVRTQRGQISRPTSAYPTRSQQGIIPALNRTPKRPNIKANMADPTRSQPHVTPGLDGTQRVHTIERRASALGGWYRAVARPVSGAISQRILATSMSNDSSAPRPNVSKTQPPAPPISRTDASDPGISLSVASWLGVLWLLGSGALLLRLLVSYMSLAAPKRRSEAAGETDAGNLLRQLAGEHGVRSPKLYRSSEISGPFLAGIIAPCIFVPKYGITDADLDIALKHELLHIKARDCLWVLLRQLLCASLWPQPLVWRLSGLARQASEESVDLQLLLRGLDRSEYANSLLRMLAGRQGMQRALAIGVAESKPSISRRIELILAAANPALNRVPKVAKFSLLASAVLLAFLASALVAFGRPNQFQQRRRSIPPTPLQSFRWEPPVGYGAAFHLAKMNGWKMAPAIALAHFSGEHIPGRNIVSPPVPPNLSSETIDEINTLNDLGQMETRFSLAQPDFPINPDSPIPGLLAFLARHPHSFYAEYELSIAYQRKGDAAKAAQFRGSSFVDAPVILAIKVEYGDGRPVKNRQFKVGVSLPGPIDTGQGEVGRPVRYFGKRATEALAVTTDSLGCIYVPTCKTVIGRCNVALPHASKDECEAPSYDLDEIVPTSKVVLIPETFIRPRVEFLAPYCSHPFYQSPLPVKGDSLNVKWKPYPGATSYRYRIVADIDLPDIGPVLHGKHLGGLTGQFLRFADRVIDEQSVTTVSRPKLHIPLTVLHDAIRRLKQGKNEGILRGTFGLSVSAIGKDGAELSSSDGFAFSIPLLTFATSPIMPSNHVSSPTTLSREGDAKRARASEGPWPSRRQGPGNPKDANRRREGSHRA